jgi:hypothetical protein
MKKEFVLIAWSFIFSLVLAACISSSPSTSGPIKVENAWARTGVTGGTGAVYFTMGNSATQDDKLVGVSSDVSDVVEMHNTLMEGGVMKMRMQPDIPLSAGGKVELKPGGMHIMLMRLKKDLKPNDTVRLTLQFEKAGKVELSAPVKEP